MRYSIATYYIILVNILLVKVTILLQFIIIICISGILM